jgi:hypothetical protein
MPKSPETSSTPETKSTSLNSAYELAEKQGPVWRKISHNGEWYNLDELPKYAQEGDGALAEAVAEYEARSAEREKYLDVLKSASFDDLKKLGFERPSDIESLSGIQAYEKLGELKSLEEKPADEDAASRVVDETEPKGKAPEAKANETDLEPTEEAEDGEAKTEGPTDETNENTSESEPREEIKTRFQEGVQRLLEQMTDRYVGPRKAYKTEEELFLMVEEVMAVVFGQRVSIVPDKAPEPGTALDTSEASDGKTAGDKTGGTEGKGAGKKEGSEDDAEAKKDGESEKETNDTEKKEKARVEMGRQMTARARRLYAECAERIDLSADQAEIAGRIRTAVAGAVKKPDDMPQEDYDKLLDESMGAAEKKPEVAEDKPSEKSETVKEAEEFIKSSESLAAKRAFLNRRLRHLRHKIKDLDGEGGKQMRQLPTDLSTEGGYDQTYDKMHQLELAHGKGPLSKEQIADMHRMQEQLRSGSAVYRAFEGEMEKLIETGSELSADQKELESMLKQVEARIEAQKKGKGLLGIFSIFRREVAPSKKTPEVTQTQTAAATSEQSVATPEATPNSPEDEAWFKAGWPSYESFAKMKEAHLAGLSRNLEIAKSWESSKDKARWKAERKRIPQLELQIRKTKQQTLAQFRAQSEANAKRRAEAEAARKGAA